MEKDKAEKPKGLTGELNSGVKYEPKNNILTTGNLPLGNLNLNGMSAIPQTKQKSPEELAAEFEKLKTKLDGFKKKVLAKYKFTKSLAILPQNALPFFAEDENMPVELEKTNPLILLMLIPEEEYKNIPKIKPEVLKMIKETGENIWLMIKTEVDLWNYGLDSKFEFIDAMSAAFPIWDNSFLGCLRLASIHKSLVLRKFEKYIASYGIFGSFVRGNADKTSDVDTFVIVDDTDVKRMNRLELLEKLRGIIFDYIREATALAGVKNPLNVQVYLLTDFWQLVKDANPVMFTLIRDGIPLYDRGTFIPWKLLLKMGKIKPSPESVDMFMKSGEQNESLVKRRLIDAMVDIFWGIVTPTQALMMLTGNAPPEPNAIVAEVKRVLVDKEKLMSIQELNFLEKIVKLYKDYEHAKINEISGKEVDELLKGSTGYVKKIKALRQKIEDRMQEHEAERLYDETFKLMKNIFGDKSAGLLIKSFESEMIKKGKVSPRMLGVAKSILEIKEKFKGKKKLSAGEMQQMSRDGADLIEKLLEYAQRKELVSSSKGVMQISYGANGEKKADVAATDSGLFLIESTGVVKKISGNKLIDSDKKEFDAAMASTKDRLKFSLDFNVLAVLRKELGEFKVVF